MLLKKCLSGWSYLGLPLLKLESRFEFVFVFGFGLGFLRSSTHLPRVMIFGYVAGFEITVATWTIGTTGTLV